MNKIIIDDVMAGTVDYERSATALHATNRQRADLFRHKIMADSYMDVMLTALIAHEQGTRLKKQAAIMANCISTSDADAIIPQLSAAGLLRVEGDHLMLTEHGVMQMRRYMEQAMADR